MSATLHPESIPALRGTFTRLLCGVNGSRGSDEAMRQALALAAPGATLHFVAVSDERGTGPNRAAALSEFRAQRGLDIIRALTRGLDLHVETELVHGVDPPAELLARQADHELLVVGCHRETRFGGILTGSTATELAHRTRGSLLIARASRNGQPFPSHIVVAIEDRRRSRAQFEPAVALAAATGATLQLVHVEEADYSERTRHMLAELVVEATELTGHEPIADTVEGPIAHAVAHEIRRAGADLLVCGHSGRSGVGALRSVSERLVHEAPCSVMVVPAR